MRDRIYIYIYIYIYTYVNIGRKFGSIATFLKMIVFSCATYLVAAIYFLLHITMAAETVKRPRAAITDVGLASELLVFATKKGKSFIRFDDAATVKESVNDEKLLEKHKAILDACGDEPIVRKTVKAAMATVLAGWKGKWKIAPQDEADWVETMTRRFLNMMYHHHKGSSAKKSKATPKKAAAATQSEDGNGSKAATASSAVPSADALETEDPEKKPATVPKTAYEFGWNGELGLGWRKKVGQSDKQKEISLAPEIPEQAENETVLLVTFVDGMQKKYTLAKAAFEIFSQRRSSSTTVCKPLLEAEHVVTHNKITVRQRPNRGLLISMYDQAKQVMQVRADRFGEIAEEVCAVPLPHESEIIKKAVEFYQPIFDKYIKNKIVDKMEVYAARDERYRELGMSITRKGKQRDNTVEEKDNVKEKKIKKEKAGNVEEKKGKKEKKQRLK